MQDTQRINKSYKVIIIIIATYNELYISDIRGVGRKIFWGFPKWCKQNVTVGDVEGISFLDAEGASHFCTTFVAVFTKLVSN